MNRQLKVYYMERSGIGEGIVASFSKTLKGIFSKMGYEPDIRNYIYEPSQKELNRLLDNDEIDIVVSDLTLGTRDNDGLKLIKKIKTDHPEIIVCGFSKADISVGEIASQVPSYDYFIDKSCNDEKDQRECADAISGLFKYNVDIEIQIDDEINQDDKMRKLVKSGEFKRLLKKITFTTHNANEITLVKKAHLYPMSGGFSSSIVFRMECETSQGVTIINSVLKCSPLKEANVEIENYLNYVKWYLPYTWRPEMLSYALGGKRGMICYSFAYNNEKPFTSLTEKIREANIEKLNHAISAVFSDSTKKWYSEENREPVNNSLRDYYLDFYFRRYSSKPPVYRAIYLSIEELVNQNGGRVEGERYSINGVSYPAAKELVLYDSLQNFQTCIIHGDFNTNNIMISEDNELIFIDFQETGIGHVFQDFIAFEICLKIYHKANLDFNRLLEIEAKLANNNSELSTSDPIIHAMQSVKQAAFLNMPDENPSTYNYGLAMRAFRLLKENDDHPMEKWQRDALLACLLANLLHLETERNKKQPAKAAHAKTQKKALNRFKIGVTFIGEHREAVVVPILDELLNKYNFDQNEIFYDEWYPALINGIGGAQKLQKIYLKDCELVVVFLCKRYQDKPWTGGVEWRAILELINSKAKNKEICLVNVDGVEVAAINGLFGTSDIAAPFDKYGVSGIAGMIADIYQQSSYK